MDKSHITNVITTPGESPFPIATIEDFVEIIPFDKLGQLNRIVRGYTHEDLVTNVCRHVSSPTDGLGKVKEVSSDSSSKLTTSVTVETIPASVTEQMETEAVDAEDNMEA